MDELPSWANHSSGYHKAACILPGDRLTSENKAVGAAKYQSFKDLFDALTLCKFAPYSPTNICDILNAITGWSVTTDELLSVGNRSINIKRLISMKLGLTGAEDRLPEPCLKVLDEGSTAGKIPDMELLLKDYYNYRKWDMTTGKPTEEALAELGLTDLT